MRAIWPSCLILLLLVACTAPKLRTATPTLPPCRQDGLASWYGPQPGSDRMADGRHFDPAALTAAQRWLPLGTKLRVTDLDTGRSVLVRVTDRGPTLRSRIIDVSRAAAKVLAMKHDGVAHVQVEAATPAACAAWRAARPSAT